MVLRKIREVYSKSNGESSFYVDGYRYARCRECGKFWNIAKGQRIRQGTYICPACVFGLGTNKNLKGW